MAVASMLGVSNLAIPAALAGTPGATPVNPYGEFVSSDSPPPAGFDSVSENLTPQNDPSAAANQLVPAYFYARQFFWNRQSGGGYVGIQTDHNGKRVLFSIWGATTRCAAGPGGSSAQVTRGFDGSSQGGCKTDLFYNWDAGHTYRLTVGRLSATTATTAPVWQATVTDMTTATSRVVGDIGVPGTSGGLQSAALDWIEYYGPTANRCDQYPYAAVQWSQATATAPTTGTITVTSARTWTSSQGSCSSSSRAEPGWTLDMSSGYNVAGLNPYNL